MLKSPLLGLEKSDYSSMERDSIFDIQKLSDWEQYLDSLNSNCFVDKKLLLKIFSEQTVIKILNTRLRNSENISYLNSSSSFTPRYINDAFIYHSIFEHIDSNLKTVIDACSGSSKVIDTALALNGFCGTLEKVDYNKQSDNEETVLKHEYSKSYHTFDIIKNTEKVPKTDAIVLNHAIDDLFMGLWSEDTKVDYFGECLNKIEKNNMCWKAAVNNSEKYVEILKNFIVRLSQRLNDCGYIIIKSYPSGFETQFKQIERINFTYNLVKSLVNELTNNGLKSVIPELNLTDEFKWNDISNMFFIIQNKK